MSSRTVTTNAGSFQILYVPNQRVHAVYHNHMPLEQELASTLLRHPIKYGIYNPAQGRMKTRKTLLSLADQVFNAIDYLKSNGQNCLAAMFASYFFERFTPGYNDLIRTGRHVLAIPYWRWIVELAWKWEVKHAGRSIHKGTPYYFLSESYLLCDNEDAAFNFLFKAIEDDILLGTKCPALGYPINAPAYKVACLVDDPNNHMYPFVIAPLRNLLEKAITLYNQQFGRSTRYSFSMARLDPRFLTRSNTGNLQIEPVKHLFVLELLKLRQLKALTANGFLDNDFSRMLTLNRLFGMCLVIDKLLYAKLHGGGQRGKETEMFKNVLAFANSIGVTQRQLEQFMKEVKFKDDTLDEVLPRLTRRLNSARFKKVPREVLPILLSLKVRNTSAHNISSHPIILYKFDRLLQTMLDAVFIIVEKL